MATFFKSKNGSVICKLDDRPGTPSLDGEEMIELIPGTTEAATEKHIPVAKEENGKVYVQVGEVIHPMLEAHFIEWIYLLTDKGGSFRFLRPGEEPKAVFALNEEEIPLAVYAYCNLHGLWKADLD